jgi:hypothetical protein
VDGFANVVELEEVLLLLQVEKDLADDDAQGEVEHLVVKLLQVELEVSLEHALEELNQVLDLDQIDQVVLQVLTAVEDGDHEVFEHAEVCRIEQTNDLDQ